MEHFLHIDHFVHDPGLTHVSGNPVQYERVDVRLELVRFYGRIDRLPPQLHRDIVRNELAFARIFKEGFAYFCARVDGAEYVATSTMIVTRDRAEGLALRAFAAARRAKKEKVLYLIMAKPRLYREGNRQSKHRHPEPFDSAQGRLRRGTPRNNLEVLQRDLSTPKNFRSSR